MRGMMTVQWKTPEPEMENESERGGESDRCVWQAIPVTSNDFQVVPQRTKHTLRWGQNL